MAGGSRARKNRLVTIRFSHYCERARWALDRARIAYRELPHLPMFHLPAVLRASGGRGRGAADAASSPYSTPLLVTADGERLADSADIVRFACAASGEDLHPVPEVERLERRLHDRLGPHGRRVTYSLLFDNPALLPTLARRNVGPVEAATFRALLPVFRRRMMAALDINAESAASSLEVAREEFAHVGEVLAGRRYLVGDRFSAADLTFAGLAAALILPSAKEGYGANLFRRDELPDRARKLCDEFRSTPAGRHALRMYAEERTTPVLEPTPPLDRTRGY